MPKAFRMETKGSSKYFTVTPPAPSLLSSPDAKSFPFGKKEEVNKIIYSNLLEPSSEVRHISGQRRH
jgi:hypothetical protein